MSTLPWMKLPHRQYMVSFSRAALKPLERLAFIELAMYAFTQANHQLIDNDVVLAGWAGVSVKQWLAMKPAVFMEWQQVDGHWQLPAWFVIPDAPAPIGQQAVLTSETQPIKPKEKKVIDPELSAKRSAAAKQGHAKRSANLHANSANASANFADDDANAVQNVDAKPANDANMQNPDLQNAANLHANEGGKGGDLDLNLDKDLDKKQKKQRDANADASRVLSSQAVEIFEHWKKVFSKRSDVIFSEKRKGKVIARLKQHYTMDQIKLAIDNCAKSDFHVTNQHTGLELICCDPEHLDRFIDFVPPPPTPAKPQQPAGQRPYYPPANTEPEDHVEFAHGITYGQIRSNLHEGESYQACMGRLVAQQRLKPNDLAAFLALEKVKPFVTVEDVKAMAKANEVSFSEAANFLREQIEMEYEPS